jgi:hypothetical protein
VEEATIREELEMVHQAFFTEPDDQTAYWYHQFLIGSVATARPGPVMLGTNESQILGLEVLQILLCLVIG